MADRDARIGYAGAQLCGGRPIHAAFDLHIEQGPILESENKTIEVEDAKPEWIEAGANVLLHAMLERACEPR
uniref:Beta-ureidopropionase n=1 Tax=Mycetohabitans sp. TaxID=2571162 RepID=A0A6B9HFC8_9BURK|nr:beta-ureidopropionase [Mycetohabitans sp.]